MFLFFFYISVHSCVACWDWSEVSPTVGTGIGSRQMCLLIPRAHTQVDVSNCSARCVTPPQPCE